MRFSKSSYDAVIVGSGPNGLAAAITIAQTGRSVLVVEAKETVGGGARSAELTLPGFVHDVCSAVHPMALASPFFRSLPLDRYGLEWIHPPIPCAHPLDDGTAVAARRGVEETAAGLGQDSKSYSELMGPLRLDWRAYETLLMGYWRLPSHPFAAARACLQAMRPAVTIARRIFRDTRAQALFAGMAAHSIIPLEKAPSAGFGLAIGLTVHAAGWPMPRGGSQRIADALAAYLRSVNGEIVTSCFVESLDQLPPAPIILCDVTPRQLSRMAGDRLPDAFRRKLERFRYGPGVCKVDWALDGPIPWMAKECLEAGSVHVGGTLEEIADAERAPWEGRVAEKPFMILAQPSLFDSSRAPAGKHTVWAYCHVPNSSDADMSDKMEEQIERFAPGFRARILQRSVRVASAMEAYNPNMIGGDILGGANLLSQCIFRPTARLYGTPTKGLYLCSASTPPGGGVHGLCGHLAARMALKRVA
jgi:phytoene dehydrogenase-like protein